MAVPTNVYDLAHLILDAIVAQFAADNVSLPERRYVTGVEFVAECPALVVAFDRIYMGVPGAAETPSPVTHGIHRVAQYTIWISRCVRAVPMDTGYNISAAAPSIDHFEEDAAEIMTDGYTLHRGLVRAHFSGSELRGICEAISLGPVEPFVGGGVGGVKLTVVAELS